MSDKNNSILGFSVPMTILATLPLSDGSSSGFI